MKKILFALMMLGSIIVKPYHTYALTLTSGGCLEADILIVVDWSGSTQANHEEMVGAIYNYSRSFTLSDDGIKIGIVSFGDTSSIQSFITSDTDQLDNGMNNLFLDTWNHGTNADSVPMLVATTMLMSTQERGRKPARRFVIIISDGETAHRQEFISQFTQTTDALDITTFSIFLGKKIEVNPVFQYQLQPVEQYEIPGWSVMRSIASPNCFLQGDYEELREMLIRLNLCI